MKCQFSEKFYEIMFDHELLSRANNPRVYIPSQNKEKDLGYDIYFKDGPKKVMFIQFKVPYTSNTKKKEYRFELHKNNGYSQHNKLCDYNTKAKKIVAMYYAPLFVTVYDLNRYSKSGTIIHHSKLFIPVKKHKIISAISLSKFHYVRYDRTCGSMHSDEGISIETKTFEELLQELVPINLKEFKEEAERLNTGKQSACCFAFFE